MTVGELAVLRSLKDPLDRYVFLRDLRDVDEPGFYRLLVAYTEELLPIVYTPTVGDAALQYHTLPIAPQGLYITSDDAGNVLQKLRSWPKAHLVSCVVLTDGERVLGLGDLGAGGLAISEGKILLYSCLAGVHPDACLPLCLDVGTNNQQLLDDPAYKGLRRRRLRGPTYEALLDEVVCALKALRHHLLLQWEDFGADNAFRLLARHRQSLCSFNDDIQGTAAVALAALISALRAAGVAPRDARLLFLGAGEAGTGIGELWSLYLVREHGVSSLDAARRSCTYLDSQGLVCASRHKLAHHKRPFAHDVPFVKDLLVAVRAHRPHVLLGVAAQGGAFTAEVLREMAALNERPVLLPLSNPTSLAECTAAEAFEHTAGRCLFASGSPFPAVRTAGGRLLEPSQANNAYIFPALGYGALLCAATSLPDEAFLEAAKVLAAQLADAELVAGALFPPWSRIRDTAARIAAAVAAHAVADGRGVEPQGLADAGGWERYARAHMWYPQPLPIDAKL